MANLTRCLAGKHPLVEVYSHSRAFRDVVVRWCPICGAIVVDEDADGITIPGNVMKMQTAELYKEEKTQCIENRN